MASTIPEGMKIVGVDCAVHGKDCRYITFSMNGEIFIGPVCGDCLHAALMQVLPKITVRVVPVETVEPVASEPVKP